MSRQLGPCSKVRWAVFNRPHLLKSILADPNLDKVLTKHILYDMLPRRTSIEIECIGTITDHARYLRKDIKDITEKHRVISFDVDEALTDTDYTEHKISISNYKQLTGLYDILALMKEHCTLNTISGCHIHVDITKTKELPEYWNERLQRFMQSKINNGTIEKILGKYYGNYPRKCEIAEKSSWVNIRNSMNSVEFRTAPMTFDYNLIISWFIQLNKLINEFENNLKLQ
jgi:hypothetical protein